MEDKTLRVYQGNILIREYSENSAAYREVCSYFGIPQANCLTSDNSQMQMIKATKFAILEQSVKDVRMTSFYEGSENYKLYQLKSADAWLASAKTYDIPEKDYLQVQFKKIQTVTAICLQGRGAAAQWITKFKLTYSENGNEYYYAKNGYEFDGCNDQTTIRTITIPKLRTKFLRFIPTAFHSYKTCRFDVLIET